MLGSDEGPSPRAAGSIGIDRARWIGCLIGLERVNRAALRFAKGFTRARGEVGGPLCPPQRRNGPQQTERCIRAERALPRRNADRDLRAAASIRRST